MFGIDAVTIFNAVLVLAMVALGGLYFLLRAESKITQKLIADYRARRGSAMPDLHPELTGKQQAAQSQAKAQGQAKPTCNGKSA